MTAILGRKGRKVMNPYEIKAGGGGYFLTVFSGEKQHGYVIEDKR